MAPAVSAVLPSSAGSSATGDPPLPDVTESDEVERSASRPRKRQRHRATEFTRSRGGCEACKQHKKKCDQQQPICTRCRSGHKTCRYPAPVIWAPAEGTPTAERRVLDNGVTPLRHPSQDLFAHQEARLSAPDSGPHVPSTAQAGDISVVAISPELLTTSLSAQSHAAFEYAPNDTSTNPWETLLPSSLPSTDFAASSFPVASQTPVLGSSTGTEWNFGGDAFLQALFALAPAQTDTNAPHSQALGPTTIRVAEPVTPRRQTSGPLAVPIDCDPALWAFFVDTSRWEEQEPNEDERSLLEYYMSSTAFGVVIQDGTARRFFQECASRAKVERGRALMHAVLCLSAQHLSNKARTENDRARTKRYRDISTEHRAQALHLLRVAAAANAQGEASDILPAIMILLILATFLKGEPGIIPSFLDQTSKLLDKATARMSSSEVDLVFLPSVSALHSMYTAFHALNAQKQISLTSLFPSRDTRPVWEERSCEVLETVVGIPKSALMLLLKANELVLEYETVMKALSRDSQDDELSMMRIELQARASALDADLDEEDSSSQPNPPELTERLRLGQECCRIAARMMLLVDVLDEDVDSPRVLALVEHFADQLEACGERITVRLTENDLQKHGWKWV